MNLKNKIIQANKAYRSGNAIISDIEYDKLLEQYKQTISINEFEKFTNTLNEGVIEYGEKIKHPFIMGSLSKLKYESPDEIDQFIDKYCNDGINVSAKVDGISCRLHYENGILISASTRGNGIEGILITDKIKYVKCIPQILGTGKLSGKYNAIDIRGELVILKDDFTKMSGFANPRNACAGIMNRKDFRPEDVSNVTFVAYTILGKEFPKDEQFALLESWGGFKVAWNKSYSSKYWFKDRGRSAADEFFNLVQQDFEYEVDGLVVCSTKYINEDKYKPDACIAFKTNQLTAVTRVVDVEFYGPSKDGFFIPVSILEPVELGGSTISKASLHNLNFMNSKNIKYGSKVMIVKGGDIIPGVVSVLENPEGSEKISLLETCPCCGTKLVEDGINSMNLRCMNKKCNAQMIHKITWLVKNCGVKGASNKTLENFGIFCVDDLLKFKPDKKYKSETKFYDEILTNVFTKSKRDLIAATDIQDLGEKTINKIIDFYTLDVVIEFAKNNTIPSSFPSGVGESTTTKFLEALPAVLEDVDKIVNDVRYCYVEEDSGSSRKTKEYIGSVCFTGALNSMSRNEASKKAEAAGYEVKSGVSKGLTYLVTNTPDSGSSKNKKAQQLGTKVITEEDFLKLVNNVENDLNFL